jgi:hypothetical protein
LPASGFKQLLWREVPVGIIARALIVVAGWRQYQLSRMRPAASPRVVSDQAARHHAFGRRVPHAGPSYRDDETELAKGDAKPPSFIAAALMP